MSEQPSSGRSRSSAKPAKSSTAKKAAKQPGKKAPAARKTTAKATRSTPARRTSLATPSSMTPATAQPAAERTPDRTAIDLAAAETSTAPPAKAAAAPTPRDNIALALGGAAALVLVGSLLPWVRAQTVFGSISFAGTDGDGVLTLITALIVGALSAALLLGKRPRLWAYVVATLAALLCVAVSMYDLANVSAVAGNDYAHVSAGAGLWITALAGVVLLVAAVQATRKRKRPAEPTPAGE